MCKDANIQMKKHFLVLGPFQINPTANPIHFHHCPCETLDFHGVLPPFPGTARKLSLSLSVASSLQSSDLLLVTVTFAERASAMSVFLQALNLSQ